MFLILIVMWGARHPDNLLITAVGTAGVAIGWRSGQCLLRQRRSLLANCAPPRTAILADIGGQSGVVSQIRLMNTTLQDLGQPAHRGAEQYGCQIDDHQLFVGKAEAFGFELAKISWQG